MANIGLVVFANDSGLGAQTRRLTHLVKPDRLLVIDSSTFSKNKVQHTDWYSGFNGYIVKGFPVNRDVEVFMSGLTHVLVCENPMNFHMLTVAKNNRIKLYIQSNYEFCDHLDKQLELPTQFLMPSHWKVEEMQRLFGENKVQYLPPPIDPNEFKDARDVNMRRTGKPRLLHIVGTLAANDRNGTLDLLASLKYTTSDFDLVIRSQHALPDEYMVQDYRVKFQVENIADQQTLYRDFDALITPRRYGGLSLTTNEALMSALPVFMPDISPNNQLLPSDWLYPATIKEQLYTRTFIDVYQSDHIKLAQKIDWICSQELPYMKIKAFNLGYDNFAFSVLQKKYEDLWT